MPESQSAVWPKVPDRTDWGILSNPIALVCGLSVNLISVS